MSIENRPFYDPAAVSSSWGIAWAQNHVDFLEARGVTREIASARGYRTVTEKATLERAGFSKQQVRVPGLLIPMRNAWGQDAGFQYRPDAPRPAKNGKPVKYETRAGQPVVVDVPAAAQIHLDDPSVPLWITEGPVKADSACTAGLCCIALTGVWNFRGVNSKGGKTLVPDFDAIALDGRRVVIAFDSDALTKVSVYDAAQRLAGVLTARGAHVDYLHLPDAPDRKIGLDDYLAEGHDLDELQTLVDADPGERPTPPATEPTGADGHHLTDLGNAHRLVAAHGDSLRYVAKWGRWLAWDGVRFAVDDDDVRVTELAADVPRRLWQLVPNVSGAERDRLVKWATKSESAGTIAATARLARTVSGMSVSHTDLDADAWLLNVENGTIDLRTGQLLDHDPNRLLTKLAPTRFEPGADAPVWTQFLETVLPNPDVRDYVQRLAGYSITGDVREQVFVIATGVGRNGKSTMFDAITAVLGEYAVTAPKDLLLQTRHEPHPTSMTTLFGARFASAIETDKGTKLAEAQVKQLVGGDKITARRMREDFWEFEPTHKLWMACNHLPKINGTDLAIWRRIRVIPFDVVIPEDRIDLELKSKLRAEAPGILAWLVRGCQAWQAEGLETPAVVLAATTDYRTESNWLNRFCSDFSLVIDPGGHAQTTVSEMRDMFERWCRDEGLHLSRREFNEALEMAGCEQSRTSQARVWKGIRRDD